jgi:hypothetical protein
VDDHVRIADLFKSGAKRFDELVGKVSHKTHRVYECEGPAIGGGGFPHGRVQGGKQGVFNEQAGASKAVHQ